MSKKAPKGSSVNKSQAIRDALAKNPDASPKDLSAELTAQGVKVTAAFVSMIKFKAKIGRKPGRKKGRSNLATGLVDSHALLEAKKLVDRVGGIDKAQSLLGTLRKLL